MPEKPWENWIPLVSWSLSPFSSHAFILRRQRPEITPAPRPMARAKPGVTRRQVTELIATPPEMVAFRSTSISSLWKSILVMPRAPMQPPVKAKTVLITALSYSPPASAMLKLGQ